MAKTKHKTKQTAARGRRGRARKGGARGPGAKHQRTRRGPRRADTADKYALYQESVQEPDVEVEFFERAYKRVNGRMPKVLREDFCGTFAICCRWAARRGRRAIAVDIDPEPLAWGREHNLTKIPPAARERVEILQDDVRTRYDHKVDVLAAQNFSYWIFDTREAMREYLRVAYEHLADDGILVLDAVGGPESYEDGEQDVREQDGFTYVWDLHHYDPISRHATFHIHFRFKDKSSLEKAFVYSWRFWTIPEIREILKEAGFRDSVVYWEGEDEDGEGDGEYEIVDEGTNDAAWICYIVANK